MPVTVKIRSGWDDTSRDPVAIARACEAAGAEVITLHPRTRTDMFSGRARWEEIARVVEAVDVPVIGNGDIVRPDDAYHMWRETGCAGIMIARGSFGNPWIFQQTRALIEGRTPHPIPGAAERFAVALRHARLAIEIQGDDRQTAIEFRKHLGWYVKALPGASDLRRRLHQVEAMAEVERVFVDYLSPALAVG